MADLTSEYLKLHMSPQDHQKDLFTWTNDQVDFKTPWLRPFHRPWVQTGTHSGLGIQQDGDSSPLSLLTRRGAQGGGGGRPLNVKTSVIDFK